MKNLKNKKILFLADYTTVEVPAGGAEITDSYVLKAARALKLDVRTVRPNRINTKDVDWCDLVIFSNNFEFPDSVRNKLMAEKKYICFNHDTGRWLGILKKRSDFLNRSLGTIFLSPLHRDGFADYLKSCKNVTCIPPHIPFDFRDKGLERNNRVIYAGNLFDLKGLYDVMKFAAKNPDLNIDFYYNRANGGILNSLKKLSNCNLLGFVPKEKLINYYCQYSYSIHLPLGVEAFGRSTAEAYLSGCNMLVNHKVGSFSYGWTYEQMRQATLFSHYDFWKYIDQIVTF